ncbi:TolC family protein [Xanthovirga aplysinae]|uniref:TolC family protein n=1 Tax=Xanthovirga aplysinae TaxID=2529853 RepID=UPI0012BCFD2C|nr:TolC family protein [Xanthovirga aplysinae]MTI32308.1 TolC family protein [Xanthovirga aplysinae]
MRINRPFRVFALAVLLLGLSLEKADAQQKLTLDQCIEIALENNLDIQKARNNVIGAEAREQQSKYNFLPNLNAAIDYSTNYGVFFDNTTFSLEDITTSTSSPRLSAELNVFNGMKNHRLLKKRRLEKESAEENVQSNADNTRRSVLGLYLQVLTDRENIRIAEDRLNLLTGQMERAQKRADAGVSNLEEFYNLKSQIASENLNRVRQENALKRDKLSLLQLLQLDVNGDYEFEGVESVNGEIEAGVSSFSMIYEKAINYSPELKIAEYNHQAAKQDIKIAEADLLPSISLFGSASSRYSSNYTDGDDESVPYFNQLQDFFSQSIGATLRIPIFNRMSTKTNIQGAKVIRSNAFLDLQQSKIDLTNNLQRSYTDVIAAQETYQAAKENLVALEESFKYSKARYENGDVDFYTYMESLNNKNRAEIDLMISRYTFILQKKVLNIYAGE